MSNEKIPTTKGEMSIPEIMESLMYSSYEANRGYGMTHEQLVKLGIGNEKFRELYDSKSN